EVRSKTAIGARGHHAGRSSAGSKFRPAAAEVHRAGGVQRPPPGQAEPAAQRDSRSPPGIRPAVDANARSADARRTLEFPMGPRAASLLRDSYAQQCLLSGPRGGNTGLLRAVPGGARIAQPGRTDAPLSRIAGARRLSLVRATADCYRCG